MSIIGGAVYFYNYFTVIGLTGLVVTVLDIFVIGFLIYKYGATGKRQYQQICPLCKHHWIKSSSGIDALEAYFTNVEQLRAEFDRLLIAPILSRRLLIIHGVGGVGKSSLLRMFRVHSMKKNIPVALSLGDEAKSSVDVLSNWAKDLIVQGIELPTFTHILNEYHTIRNKVEERAKSEGKLQGEASKTAIKVAVHATTSIAGSIPIIGIPLSIMLGSASDTFVDWLHNFLTKSQVELLLDPTDDLTESFLNDLREAINSDNNSQATKRIVLLLDTFEQVTVLYKWVCSLAQQLHPSILLVLAGHGVPKWDQQWPGWTTQAYIEELKPMTEEVMRELVHRYYATQRKGTPDPVQVEAIIHFARGLPIAVTSIVQLWVQYGLEDFQAIRPQVLADLVDQLTRGVPERVRPVLKAAATQRWFNEELLRKMIEEPSFSEDIYDELRRFPFVRSRREGLALHDAVREHLDDNLRVHEPARHREFHQRAAAYFEKQLKITQGEDATKLALEILYHKVLEDEVEGIKHFRKSAEELVRYQLPSQLSTLLNDVNNYPIQKENSRLWLNYYKARLKDLEGRPTEAVQIYQMIAEDPHAEELLRVYASCDWAWIARLTSLEDMEQILERIRTLIPELESAHEPDTKIGSYFFELSDLYKRQGRWSEVLANTEREHNLYERLGDTYGLASTINRLEYYYLDRGMWKEGFKMQQRGLQEVAKLTGEQQQSYLKAEFLGGYSTNWLWTGRYYELETRLQEALHIARQFRRIRHQIFFLRDLALVLGLQGKVSEANQRFMEVKKLEAEQNTMDEVYLNGFQGIIALKWLGLDDAERYFITSMNRLREIGRKEWFMPFFLNWQGILYEVKGVLELAEECYLECLDRRKFEPWYWYTGSLTGLARIYAAKGDYAAFNHVMQEAEKLSQQYEYNDHLASLRLTQGHLYWERLGATQAKTFDNILLLYKQAMTYALRYNRFLLDEIVSGRPQGTLFQPIIPCCLKHNDDGKRILYMLREWWQQGINDIGLSRSDSISLIPEGVFLLDAESLVRRQEPGDGTKQQTVINQLEGALSSL